MVNRIWTLERIAGYYHFRSNDALNGTLATKRQLAQALQLHGIVGSLYEDVCLQLCALGKAEVEVTMIKLRQY